MATDDFTKIAYSIEVDSNTSTEKSGLWVMETVNLPLGFAKDPKRITDGKLEKSIEKEVLQSGNKTIIGIGNTEKMPPYWRIQEHGGTVPARYPKFAKAMHYFGYGREWFAQRVKGFTIQAKNYFSNGYNYSLVKARWAFSVLLHKIMR